MHVSGYIVVPPARLHRATAAVQAALPKVLSMLLGLGQVKEESRRGNGTVTLGWAPVRPPPGPRYRRTAARRSAKLNEKFFTMLLLLAPIRSLGYYQHGYMAWPPICVDMIVKFHEFSIKAARQTEREVLNHASSSSADSKPGLLIPAAALAIWPGHLFVLI